VTPAVADALTRAGRLVTYPGDTYADDVAAFVASVAPWLPEAARDLAAFAAQVAGLSVEEQQELFTRTFDLNPVCALEAGWHLYGEDYERGAFLVEMRRQLRAHGIAEGGELPDHLALLLALVARLGSDDADALVARALLPAVEKMLPSLESGGSPFLPLVNAIRQVLAACAPAGQEVVHG